MIERSDLAAGVEYTKKVQIRLSEGLYERFLKYAKDSDTFTDFLRQEQELRIEQAENDD